jgi:hypothetical protein
MTRPPSTPDGLVLVLVGTLDRRIVPALRFVSTWTGADLRAVHVAIDPAATARLASEWMALDVGWLPLHVHDAVARTLPASIVASVVAEATAAGVDRCTVVVPQLDVPGRWQQLLHRHTGTEIARALARVPGVTTLVAPLVPVGAQAGFGDDSYR